MTRRFVPPVTTLRYAGERRLRVYAVVSLRSFSCPKLCKNMAHSAPKLGAVSAQNPYGRITPTTREGTFAKQRPIGDKTTAKQRQIYNQSATSQRQVYDQHTATRRQRPVQQDSV